MGFKGVARWRTIAINDFFELQDRPSTMPGWCTVHYHLRLVHVEPTPKKLLLIYGRVPDLYTQFAVNVGECDAMEREWGVRARRTLDALVAKFWRERCACWPQ